MFPMTGALRLVGFALAALAQNSGDKGLLVGPTASLPKPDEEIPEDFRTTVTASIHQFENGKESSLLADVQAKRIDHGSFFCGEIQDDFPTTDLTFGAYAISAIVLILGKWSPVTGGRTPWFVALTALASRFLLASIALSRQASSQNCGNCSTANGIINGVKASDFSNYVKHKPSSHLLIFFISINVLDFYLLTAL
eukprot:m.189107 g.189107  ORF g.189107 m.189107 type:complete len:196 (+) comp39403_c2_seq9:261-848(+)